MRYLRCMARLRHLTAIAALMLLSGPAGAGEKTLMDCFAWTPVKEATPADWQAFYKASDALPRRIKGIVGVWYGKLAAPFGWPQIGDVDTATFQRYGRGETVTI